MLHWHDNMRSIYKADARNMVLADNSVQCVVTSPPYWGLRKYAGIPDLIWGDNHCEHEWGNELITVNSGGGYAADYGISHQQVSTIVNKEKSTRVISTVKKGIG